MNENHTSEIRRSQWPLNQLLSCNNIQWEQSLLWTWIGSNLPSKQTLKTNKNGRSLSYKKVSDGLSKTSETAESLQTKVQPWSVKFLYTSLYTWSDLMICFDSELFPQNFVWQLNNDRKSLDLYYECLK